MKYTPNLYKIIAIASLVVSASAQTGTTAINHYEKGALAFDYPEGWVLEDNLADVQTVVLTRPGSTAQIKISVRDRAEQPDIPPVPGVVPTPGPVPMATAPPKWKGLDPCDFESRRKIITNELTEQLAYQLNVRTPAKTAPVTIEFGGSKIEGARLKGTINRKPAAGEIYATRLNGRFVSLIFVTAADDQQAKSAWDTVRATLKVEPSVTTLGTYADDSKPARAGILNGKAVALPPPEYPRIARAAHASGTVVVQVTIDENGDVIATNAISGHPLLQAASVAAAKQAKFSTTRLCGEPVRVTGVINYNFVAQ